jgi:hypothetical protein
MNVKVYFPQAVALKKGIADWGDIVWDLQPILDRLTEEERTLLKVESGELKVPHDNGDFKPNYYQLKVEEVSLEGILRAIFAQLTVNQAAHQKRLVEWCRILQEPEDFLYPDGRRRYGYSETKVQARCEKLGLDSAEYQNSLDIAGERLAGANKQAWHGWFADWIPGIKQDREQPYHQNQDHWSRDELPLDRAKQIATELDFPEVLQRIQVYKDAIATERAAEQAVLERSRHEWRQWAREHGSESLKLAIQDKYPLGTQVEREVEAAAFPEPGSGVILVCESVEKSSDRRVPRQAARSLQADLKDRVVAAKATLPPGTELQVGRICAVQIYIGCDCDPEWSKCSKCDADYEVLVNRTAVPVHLTSLHHNADRWYVIDEE